MATARRASRPGAREEMSKIPPHGAPHWPGRLDHSERRGRNPLAGDALLSRSSAAILAAPRIGFERAARNLFGSRARGLAGIAPPGGATIDRALAPRTRRPGGAAPPGDGRERSATLRQAALPARSRALPGRETSTSSPDCPLAARRGQPHASPPGGAATARERRRHAGRPPYYCPIVHPEEDSGPTPLPPQVFRKAPPGAGPGPDPYTTLPHVPPRRRRRPHERQRSTMAPSARTAHRSRSEDEKSMEAASL